MPRRKPTSGQMNLMGEFFDLGLKYPPKVSWSDDHLAVVVVRFPPGTHDIDRAMSLKAATELAKTIKTSSPIWNRRKKAKAPS